MHNIYYLGLSGERSLPFGLLVFYPLTANVIFRTMLFHLLMSTFVVSCRTEHIVNGRRQMWILQHIFRYNETSVHFGVICIHIEIISSNAYVCSL